jgi:hypothetical protein
MARLARVEIFAPDEIAIVHVMNRTVRRCFLMGDDSFTGNNYDHRKRWLEIELQRLAALFGIDLLCYAVMSNHFHLVLRSRPDVVVAWSNTEVARRWCLLCPARRGEQGQPEEPNEADLNAIRNNKKKFAQIRSRLSDISWWMRLLSQTIAQRANREDGEIGKFWQARFRAVRLLDETSILACAAYVDLNPIRAAMAQTLETSDYTSVQKRIQSLQGSVSDSAGAAKRRGSQEARSTCTTGKPDGFLAPLSINERTDKLGRCLHKNGQRCSDKGFLPMPVAMYIDLLDWTARHVRVDQCGRTPRRMAPIFDRLGISGSVWCRLVKEFGRLFYAVAGKPHEIDARRSRSGRHRHKARRAARDLLAA